jgi:hypothetical protein
MRLSVGESIKKLRLKCSPRPSQAQNIDTFLSYSPRKEMQNKNALLKTNRARNELGERENEIHNSNYFIGFNGRLDDYEYTLANTEQFGRKVV